MNKIESASSFTKVRRMAEIAVGAAARQITPLGRGATSAAWRVTTEAEELIVRFIPRGTNRPTTYQSEFVLLRRLLAQGCPVPQPILNSGDCEPARNDVAEPWAVTGLVAGEAIQKRPFPLSAARDLGRFLAVLHRLPFAGYGRLEERSDALVGLQSSQQAGICARWCWAAIWPFDATNLEQHPVAHSDPQLIPPLLRLQPRLLDLLDEEKVVVNHSDLHGEHLFVQEGRLTAVIDFGVAFVGLPAWEFAVLGFYHGWTAVRAALDEYTTSKPARAKLLRQARLLAVAVSLYKLDKAATKKDNSGRRLRIRQFLAELLIEH